MKCTRQESWEDSPTESCTALIIGLIPLKTWWRIIFDCLPLYIWRIKPILKALQLSSMSPPHSPVPRTSCMNSQIVWVVIFAFFPWFPGLPVGLRFATTFHHTWTIFKLYLGLFLRYWTSHLSATSSFVITSSHHTVCESCHSIVTSF